MINFVSDFIGWKVGDYDYDSMDEITMPIFVSGKIS